MSIKPVIIMGAGGHSKVLIEALQLAGREIIGLVAPNVSVGSECFGVKVIGDDKALSLYPPGDIELVNGLGALPDLDTRWELASRIRKKGFVFSQVIHPAAIISKNSEFATGVQAMAGVVVQPGTMVGEDTILNTGVLVDHDCIIGAACHLAPGVILSGNVTIGPHTHIGTGTAIIQGITIGENSVVGAGSVIYRDVPDDSLIVQYRKTQLSAKGGEI